MPSSVIRQYSYDAPHQCLRIVYVSGNVYEYFDVPAEVYEKMKASTSKGEFLNRHIKGRFSFERVK
jgi:hypothetical protein